MTTCRSRLFAASLTVLALALAGQAVAQEMPASAPAVPVQAEPTQTEPVDPAAAPAEGDEPVPHIIIAETTPPIPEVWAPIPTDAMGRSAYGLYLAGRLALMRGDGDIGSGLLARANELAPEQPRVREQAFTSALLTGDMDVAARLAPAAGSASAAFVEGGRLVRAVQDFVHGHPAAANAALEMQPIGSPHARAGLMVAPWIAAAAGDWTRALAPAPTAGDALTLSFARQNRAMLLERRRDYAEAEVELKTLSEIPSVGILFKRPYGEFLERRGRLDEAKAVYEAAAAGPNADFGALRALERMRNRGRAPALPTLREGAAEALTAAAAQAAAERGNEFAAVYLRLALNLNDSGSTRLQLAGVLDRAGLKAASRAVLSQVGPQDPALYAAARAQLALNLEDNSQPDEALAALRQAAAAAPEDPRITLILSSQLTQLKQYDEALSLLNGPLLNTADQGAQIHFLRGAVLEAMGRIPEAEAELWAALQQDGENANTLNYLGYLWVDKGLRVQEGAELIARAHALDPENGNIQDSLGWAQFKQGQFDTAVATLEEAVDKEPANAEINDHLGDAYWRVGREREARWLWSRVLTLDPDAERKAEVERKLEDGLNGVVSGASQ
ncbi:tetratricopeptide repeat protein [Brevundimonas nasdae]|uniref:tetratricopeptide repeat protein n=1 Tax=Brevundimonas nasdae TaxID=172043 RepID=UPI003F68C290